MVKNEWRGRGGGGVLKCKCVFIVPYTPGGVVRGNQASCLTITEAGGCV